MHHIATFNNEMTKTSGKTDHSRPQSKDQQIIWATSISIVHILLKDFRWCQFYSYTLRYFGPHAVILVKSPGKEWGIALEFLGLCGEQNGQWEASASGWF